MEYLAASLLDLEWHTLSATAEPDPDALERMALAAHGHSRRKSCPAIAATYFQHIFSGGYSAGYYSYIWAEVLDADAFQAFKEKGFSIPQPRVLSAKNILEKGYSEEPMVLYKRFRGRQPEVEPLLEKRGLR